MDFLIDGFDPGEDKIPISVFFEQRSGDGFSSSVGVTTWVDYSDSRSECREAARIEAIALLKQALAKLER